MAFVTVPGLKGKVFVPQGRTGEGKKHPCRDCYACQSCGDDRCQVCRRQSPDPGAVRTVSVAIGDLRPRHGRDRNNA